VLKRHFCNPHFLFSRVIMSIIFHTWSGCIHPRERKKVATSFYIFLQLRQFSSLYFHPIRLKASVKTCWKFLSFYSSTVWKLTIEKDARMKLKAKIKNKLPQSCASKRRKLAKYHHQLHPEFLSRLFVKLLLMLWKGKLTRAWSTGSIRSLSVIKNVWRINKLLKTFKKNFKKST
jgi:hypothetical protein